jgi:predicted nucleic acid-binding protein
VIAYFDTSAIIPTIIEEPASAVCLRLWSAADRVLSVRLLYPEARAALATAQRMGRLTDAQLDDANEELESRVAGIDHVEVGEQLAHDAGDLAQRHGLRGSDAVHLAAALTARDRELVVVTGDRELAVAASSLGIHVAVTTGP